MLVFPDAESDQSVPFADETLENKVIENVVREPVSADDIHKAIANVEEIDEGAEVENANVCK